MEEMFSSFLTSVKNQFGYASTYVISDKTKRFYTPTGVAKIVNPQMDPYDNWYPIFMKTGLKIQVDTNRDQFNDYPKLQLQIELILFAMLFFYILNPVLLRTVELEFYILKSFLEDCSSSLPYLQ